VAASKTNKKMITIITGVSGSGKTTVGRLVAERLGCRFIDADDVHPQANIDKMSRGIPLTDADRKPWLEALRDIISDLNAQGHSAVLACSALKQSYRDVLNTSGADIRWVYLRGTYEAILNRMKNRPGHFMKPEMLKSQFEALEEPVDALTIDAVSDLNKIVHEICKVVDH